VELQLKTAGFEVDQAGSAEEAMKFTDRADVILTDLRLPAAAGWNCWPIFAVQDSHTPVIVMTAFGSIETAVEAMKAVRWTSFPSLFRSII